MTILQKILETKKQEVEQAKITIPLTQLSESIKDLPPTRKFLERLKQDASPISLIAEIKKASPSRGIISDDFHPEVIAREYEKGGASCLSVLTDKHYFHGSNEDLMKARSACDLPVLRKDFIVDEYQIYESRKIGADCILIIVSTIDDIEKMQEWMSLANSLDMDALVETHNEHELEKAIAMNAKLIGINNRDLKTFQTDLSTTEKLAKLVPNDIFLVSESAIWTRDDVLRVGRAGVRGVLVGESLMTKANITNAVKELLGK